MIRITEKTSLQSTSFYWHFKIATKLVTIKSLLWLLHNNCNYELVSKILKYKYKFQLLDFLSNIMRIDLDVTL